MLQRKLAVLFLQTNHTQKDSKMKRDFEIAQENFYQEVAKLDWENDPDVLEKAEKLSQELNPFHSLRNFVD